MNSEPDGFLFFFFYSICSNGLSFSFGFKHTTGENALHLMIDAAPDMEMIERNAMHDTVGEIYREMFRLLEAHVPIQRVHTDERRYLLWDIRLVPMLNDQEQIVLLNLRTTRALEIERQRQMDESFYARMSMRPINDVLPRSLPINNITAEEHASMLRRQTRQVLDTGRRYRMNDLKKDSKCCVCLEKLRLHQPIYRLPCGHSAFHGECITRVIEKKG